MARTRRVAQYPIAAVFVRFDHDGNFVSTDYGVGRMNDLSAFVPGWKVPLEPTERIENDPVTGAKHFRVGWETVVA